MKIQVSQDTLYQYLTEHNVKLIRLAEIIGISGASITSCFKHQLINGGVPRSFTPKNIERMNVALGQLADNLRGCILTFGSDQVFTNQRGVTYDPALVGPIKRIGEWMNLTALVERVLGWNQDKKETKLVSPSSKNYGTISQDDVNRLNAELLSVAGVLSSYEVVANGLEIGKNKVHSTCVPFAKQELLRNPWDNTTLNLFDRYDAFHRAYPDGVIFFRVNNGYTVCQDDAALLTKIDSTLQPYTDPYTGHVTLFLDKDKFQQIRRVVDDEFVAITSMYADS